MGARKKNSNLDISKLEAGGYEDRVWRGRSLCIFLFPPIICVLVHIVAVIHTHTHPSTPPYSKKNTHYPSNTAT